MLPQPPQINASVIVMNEGKVLVGRNSYGKWETPTTTIHSFENMKDAAIRAVLDNSGVVTDPKHVLFVSEVVKEQEAIHKILIYFYADYVSGGDPFILEGSLSQVEWVDVRELSQYQDDMTDETLDSFYKFSLILRRMAGNASTVVGV